MYIHCLTILILITASYAVSAEARCVKSHVCDNWGNNCRYQDVCDSSLDLPSTNLQPLPPVRSPGLKPLPSTELPPLGTSRCEYKVVNGHWQNVCY